MSLQAAKASKKHKPYSFSAEPEIFDPVMDRIKALAVEKEASVSYIITDILLGYFNVENTTERSFNFSKAIENKTRRSGN